jgi:hypothetical protein
VYYQPAVQGFAGERRAARLIGGSMKRSAWFGITVVALSLMTGGCAKSREIAEAGTHAFRGHAAKGEFASIYREAAPEFQKSTTEADFAKLMEGIARKLGAWQSSKPPAWRVFSGTGGRTVTFGYASQFDKGNANEEFIWRIEGDGAHLVGYHINSPLFLADDLRGTRPLNNPLQQSGSPQWIPLEARRQLGGAPAAERQIVRRMHVMTSILGVLALAVSLPAVGQELVINGAAIDAHGILSFRCAVSLPSSRRMYSWRGSLQPAIGRIVLVEVRDHNDKEVEVERVAGFDPLFPDPRDVVAGTKISYSKPIRLTARQPSSQLRGCFRVRVRYDATLLGEEFRKRARLDSVSVQSDFVRVCSPWRWPHRHKAVVALVSSASRKSREWSGLLERTDGVAAGALV